MKYSDFSINKVREHADIRSVIPGADMTRATSYVRCPECGAEGKNKGLRVRHSGKENFAHCFKCGFQLNDAIDAVMHYSFNGDKKKFPNAIAEAAEASGIYIATEEEERKNAVTSTKKKISQSFCEKQLAASGLTVEDVMVCTKDAAGIEHIEPAFRKGSIDASGQIRPNDDEMLIYYYRLDGTLEQYATRGARGALRPYIRIRWSNPALHSPKDSAREIKYQTPKGAPAIFYIPQRIRTAFQTRTQFNTLIVQEGEKKAEKACKHGIMSIGIQGIYNIGNENTGLPVELQYIVQACGVKNVVLLFDSDFDHLSRNLRPDEPVDYRPAQFAGAAKKFKRYINSLHNQNVSVDIFFGHINENKADDKGIDDLLVNTLKGKEYELLSDIDFAMHAIDGKGQYCSIHKITTMSDLKIDEFWLLHDRQAFYEKYKERLKPLEQFRLNKHLCRIVDDELVSAYAFASGKEFWNVDANESTGKVSVSIDTYAALQFIAEAGFHRIHTNDLQLGEFKFVRVDNGVVSPSSATDIREFVWEYILQSTKNEHVRNHFSARLSSDLSLDKLERLDRIEDSFDHFKPDQQELYFKNGMLTVSPMEIKWNDALLSPVWEDKIIGHKFHRVPIIESVSYDKERGFSIVPTEEGAKCDFFNFLCFTSNFWWRKEALSPAEAMEFNQHLMNKITSMGYLLCDYKYQTELKAVIAMDGELSDVGQSNGRTGKSLIGKALSYMLEQTSIDGRNTKNDDDFIYTLVTLRTRNVFMDDVTTNFNFERFYFAITGDLNVNVKGGGRFVIKSEHSPKFYITTNHAINGSQTRSSQERIIYMSFSNYFNDQRHPVDVFGHQFFADWDEEQWNLFYNFMAECVFIYFTSMQQGWSRPGQGAVAPPMRDIMWRTLRQQMSESLFQWAELYFDKTNSKLNERIPRREVFRDFCEQFPDSKRAITTSNFKTKLCYYCQFKGYHFNPNKLNKEGKGFRTWIDEHPGESFIGEADKSGGIEYFQVYDTETALNQPF